MRKISSPKYHLKSAKSENTSFLFLNQQTFMTMYSRSNYYFVLNSPFAVPVPEAIPSVNALPQQFWNRHFLAGTLIQELERVQAHSEKVSTCHICHLLRMHAYWCIQARTRKTKTKLLITHFLLSLTRVSKGGAHGSDFVLPRAAGATRH